MLRSICRLFAATALSGLALAPLPALADETEPPADITITGNVALTTDYRFRGLSQTSGDPALQAGINVNHSSGFYVGVWSSSLSLGDHGPRTGAVYGSQELDLFGGWSGHVSPAIVADAGLLYYAYPGGHAGKAEFFEPYASLSTTLGPVTGRIGAAYAWKQQALNFDGGGRDDNLYLYGELSAGIPNTPVTVSGHLGYTKGALSPKYATGRSAGYAGGFDWNLGASYNLTPHLSIGGQYVGVQGNDIGGYSDDTVVGTLRFSF